MPHIAVNKPKFWRNLLPLKFRVLICWVVHSANWFFWRWQTFQ